MTGPAFVKWIETTLLQNDIPKEVFYSKSGISTANMAQWRSGEYNPSKRSIDKAEQFFENYAKKEIAATLSSDGEKAYAAIFSQLSPANQAKLHELALLYLDAQRKSEES